MNPRIAATEGQGRTLYDIRRLEVNHAEVGECEALLGKVFPAAQHLRHDYLWWQYAENPDGMAVGFNAWAGETLAAHYVTLPLRAKLGGKIVQGLLSLNTATHPEHQGKKLFTKLAEATYLAGAELGYSFVVGVANANSTPGFTKKLGFRLLRPLEARVGVGRITRRGDSEVEFERLWNRESLQWRLSNPRRPYTGRHLQEKTIVEARTGKVGIHAILSEVRTEDLGTPLPRTRAANPMRLWLGADPGVDWRRSLFAPLPQRLRASPLNLIYLELSESGRAVSAERFKYEAIDFDPY